VAERSTAADGTVVTPIWVVGGTVFPLVHAANVSARATKVMMRTLTVAMLPRSWDKGVSRTDAERLDADVAEVHGDRTTGTQGHTPGTPH
jgi:hypothetical protein